MWSPIIDSSTSTAQLEHLMAGKKLAVGLAVAILLDIQPSPSLLPTARRQAEAHSWRYTLRSFAMVVDAMIRWR